ncbi:hypothetical protein Tco_0760941 [Tanacetum coccineum]
MVGDMGDLVKDQTCDNWISNAIQVYGFDEKRPKLNPDIGTAVEYRKMSLASLDVSVLDKLHLSWKTCSGD